MIAIERAESPGSLARFAQTPGATPDTIDEIRRHGADEHWMVAGAAGYPLARCSLWWKETPALPGHRIGLIGHYAATDDTAAGELLDAVCQRLAAAGCSLAIGPMDGSTWRNHRHVTWRGHTPPFFLDITHPPEWPQHFAGHGFRTLANYSSSMIPDTCVIVAGDEERVHDVEARGVTLRRLNGDRFTEELRRIYRLSTMAFRGNFLYTPIDENEFIDMYLPMRRYVRSDLVLLAERGGELVGFVFCVPDHLQGQREGTIDTVVLKTFAVHPDVTGQGLGSVLVTEARDRAAGLGYRKLVIAFMHENNPSLRISTRYAGEIRRYTLFSRKLGDHANP